MSTDLSFAEEQLWLADQASPLAVPFVDCALSLSIVVRLRNALDRQALAASLNEIIRRHDVLRSRFAIDGGRPVRRFEPSLQIDLTEINLRGISSADRPDRVTHVIAEDARRRFDLTRDPLLRATLVTLADDEHVLAITVHHLVFDRWSRRVLVMELKELYEAYSSGRTPKLEPLAMQYPDYVQWQRQRLESALGRTLIDHWTTRLRDLTDLALPCDGSRERAVSTRSGKLWFTIPATDAERLGAMSRRCRLTLATLMLAIFKLFLYRLSGVHDVAVGVPVSDRRRPEFERMIGLFTNVVVVRTAIADGMTFLELLDRTRGNLVEACRYQDMPFGYLLQVMGARRPLHRVLFNFMPDIPESELELAGLHVEPVTIATEPESSGDLSLNVHYKSGALVCRLVYKADLFSSVRMQDVAARIRTLVTHILDEPQKRVDAFELAGPQSDTPYVATTYQRSLQ